MKIKYETERLIVREWKDKDYKDLFEYASNKEVTKFLHFKIYESEEDAKTRIATLKENYKTENRYGEFAVEIKSEKKVIGSVNLGLDTIKAGGIVTLGYTLNPKHQRKGYMTECIKGMFKYIKENKLAKRIQATHDVANSKSGAVMKRCGMTFEGIARKAGEQIFVEELDERYKIYYNYLTPEKLKSLLEQANIVIDDVKCVKDNDNASSYATGLMVFQATNEHSLAKDKNLGE